KGAVGGVQYGLVEVTDAATPGGDAALERINGIRRTGGRFEVHSTSTYQVVRVMVPPGTRPPIAVLEAPMAVEVGEDFVLEGSRSCDADGVIVEYQWDFLFDGTFEPLIVTTEPRLSVPARCEPAPQPFSVALRVKDNDGFFSAIQCEEPAPGSTYDQEACSFTGDPPRNCQTVAITGRQGPPTFATDVNASGQPAATAGFVDTQSSGQHALVIDGPRVFIVYHAVNIDFTTGNVFFARSQNGGASFETPVNLSMITLPTPMPGQEPPEDAAVYPAIALMADGNPAVVYGQGPLLDQDIHLRLSVDRGTTFTPAIKLLRSGNQGQPSIAADHSSGALFMAYVDWAATGGDRILVTRATPGVQLLETSTVNDIASDAGATVRYRTNFLVSQTAPAVFAYPSAADPSAMVVAWSDAARVGNDRAQVVVDQSNPNALGFGGDIAVAPPPGERVYQFQPSPVALANGRVAVAYREARVVSGQVASDIFVSQSAGPGIGSGFGFPVQVSDASGLPRYAFAPSLAAGPGSDLMVAWQGAPGGDLTNYDLFFDSSPDGSVWGMDTTGIDNEEIIDNVLRKEQAFNPNLATTGCDVFVLWAGPANPADTSNTFSAYVDVGS
ncbi:MAG TPA: hypothetical protein VEI97_05135, partial [bacterium]|nr:hypothetical protein [bacterium]